MFDEDRRVFDPIILRELDKRAKQDLDWWFESTWRDLALTFAQVENLPVRFFLDRLEVLERGAVWAGWREQAFFESLSRGITEGDGLLLDEHRKSLAKLKCGIDFLQRRSAPRRAAGRDPRRSRSPDAGDLPRPRLTTEQELEAETKRVRPNNREIV